MSLFVARQPILDQNQETYGYEILFRSGAENVFNAEDGDQASMSVIDTSFFQLGLGKMTGGKKAFINCTRNLLLNQYIDLLPKDDAVIEILEDITPDQEVVEACYRLKNAGYTIALDDFEYTPDYDPLIATASIIKVDFLALSSAERMEMAERFLPMGIILLAEKVETQPEFEEAKEMGYTLFQGYFFSKPTLLSSFKPPEIKVVKLQLLREVNQIDFSVRHAEDIIKHDPSLAAKLLRYINSSFFGVRNEVQSIRQALALLGQKTVRKWISIQVLSSIGDEKPSELLIQTVVRAMLCQLIAPLIRCQEDELFMLGMFSLLDALMEQPMEELLQEMPISDQLKAALTGEPSRYRLVLQLVEAFEKADWENLSEVAAELEIKEELLPDLHAKAIEWGGEMMLT